MKQLVVWLALPLLGLAALLLLASYWLRTDSLMSGVFANLATELLGIVITVFYVDWVIRNHEREKWQRVDERIAERLRILLNCTVSCMRGGLAIDFRALKTNINDPYLMHLDVMRVGTEVIGPRAESIVGSLDSAGWKRLADRFFEARSAVSEFVQFFQSRVSPTNLLTCWSCSMNCARG